MERAKAVLIQVPIDVDAIRVRVVARALATLALVVVETLTDTPVQRTSRLARSAILLLVAELHDTLAQRF